MVRPLVLLFQEYAEQTVAPVTPDLNAILVGPAYQIYDYPDDKQLIEVSAYGTLNMPSWQEGPPANIPAITLAGMPNAAPGSWVDPASVRIFFDEARVVLTSGEDGVTPNTAPYENYFQSEQAEFITNKVQAGDVLFVNVNEEELVLTILGVESETLVRVASNFDANAEDLTFRVERKVNNVELGNQFIVRPTFRESNEIKILGGVTTLVGLATLPVSYARVYVAYRALRTDLQNLGSVNSRNEILSKVGRIDSRNPLGAALFVARQNAGQAPIHFYGVPSDDVSGFTAARDALSVDETLYAIVPLTTELSVIASLKTENEQFADPSQAINDGVTQKFRVVIGSGKLPASSVVIPENVDGQAEQQDDAVPPGNRLVEIVGLDALTNHLKPGDKLTISASNTTPSVDGTYTISHINSENVVEVEEEFATEFVSPTGAAINFSVVRPSTNLTLVESEDQRMSRTHEGVTYTNRLAGYQSPARTVSLVEDTTAPNSVYRITEESGTTTIYADFESGNITAQRIVNALQGQGVVQPFAGSVYITAAVDDAAEVQNGNAEIEFSADEGYENVRSLRAIGALDGVFNRLYDPNATFFTSEVQPGDIIEIPRDGNSAFSSNTKRFVVDQVLSEQRLRITNQNAGAFRNNSSTAEYELPHFDNRLGQGTLVTNTAIRYRVLRELSKDQQVAELVTVSQSFNSRRAILTWPDKVWVAGLVDGSKVKNADGTLALADAQPGYYLSAALGGMTAGLPSQQGFSRLGIAGISKIEHANDYFSDKQLTDLSDGGWYVFAQNSPSSLPYSIHQLTTDPSTLESGEFSIVKNFDFVSLFFLGVLEPFLGVWNINNDTIGFVRQAMNTGIEQLKLRRVAKIGAPLKDATLTSVAVSLASSDRIEVYVEVGLPKPLNTIGLHLVA
jgi:hypothetical protein